jgi:hypothetical protein
MKHFVHRADPAGQRIHGLALQVANILRPGEGQVHRPDENGTEPFFQSLVEAGIVPQAGTNPHQPDFLILRGSEALTNPFLHLVTESPGMVHCPV